MINNETYKFYLQDLCTLLKEDAALAYRHKKESGIDQGIVIGYQRVLSSIKHQCQVFGIDLRELKLDDFDPEDLLFDKFHYSLSDDVIKMDQEGRKIAKKQVKFLNKRKSFKIL